MIKIVRFIVVAALAGFILPSVKELPLTQQALAQADCNPHLSNPVNCKKKTPSPVPSKKLPLVCVDPGNSRCERTIGAGLRIVMDGGTIVVTENHVFRENITLTKPVVLCVGDTAVSARSLRCAKQNDILGGGRKPVKVFKVVPRNANAPCIDIRPPFDSEVSISGIHVVASRQYRAGECVWQKSGALRLSWSRLEGDNTAVGMLALTGKSAHVEGNVIEGGQNGIKIFPPDPGTFVIIDNDISLATTGLRVQGGSNVLGVGNKIHHNSGDGIVGLEGDAFYAKNEIYDNEGSGIKLDRDRITHSIPRTEADVVANTMDSNEEGAVTARDEAVAETAVNCISVKDRRDYRRHMKRYKKEQELLEHNDKTVPPGEIRTPVQNVYWLETWGRPSDPNVCGGIRGGKWKKLCVRYVQLCEAS